MFLDTIDFADVTNPSPRSNLEQNGINNVQWISTINPLKWILRNACLYDLVYIDLLHEHLLDIIVAINERTTKHNIVAIHDIYCEPTAEMLVPVHWEQLKEKFPAYEFIGHATKDNAGNLNGMGFITINKKDEKVESLIEKINNAVNINQFSEKISEGANVDVVATEKAETNTVVGVDNTMVENTNSDEEKENIGLVEIPVPLLEEKSVTTELTEKSVETEDVVIASEKKKRKILNSKKNK